MFENPVAKRTAIAAAIGAVVAVPLPFVGPIIGALVGGGSGYFTANQRGLSKLSNSNGQTSLKDAPRIPAAGAGRSRA
jgi:hypothetical protein